MLLKTLVILEKLAVRLPTAVMLSLGAFLLSAGWDRLDSAFLLAPPTNLGRDGGIGPLLFNTASIVGAALAVAVPLSLATAWCIAAQACGARGFVGWFAVGYGKVVAIGLCLPRLVWGLAGAALFGGVMGMGLSAASGALTLAALICPILISGFREGLVQAASPLLVSCRVLGLTERDIWLKEVLPASLTSLKAACLLATGRALGDAAALMLTAGFSLQTVTGPADPASTLAVYVYVLAIEVGGGYKSAMAAAFVLFALNMLILLPFVRTIHAR